MTAYYNENDPFAAQWLRNLILQGHLPRGDVDERSITEVKADDLKAYSQCHFFAGIGGWAFALKLAMWDDTRFLWTGSCPCQPFSKAGRNTGTADEKHLWPIWFRLIRQCRPTTIFGEQVASAAANGWLDETADDLEDQDYAVGAAILPACGVGAWHQRDRLWFVAHNRNAETNKARVDLDTVRFGNGLPQGEICPRRNSLEHSNWWASEPAVVRVADGVPSRVGRLRAYGNAIVPQVAAEFIAASMEHQPKPLV